MEAEAFKKRFLPFHPKLYRIALALVGNKNDAEDILQEVYCKMWNKREELKNVRCPEAYSVTLVKHTCLDFFRSPQANRHQAALETVDITDNSSPDEDMERADELQTVRRIIEKLPENQKIVVKLRGLSDCSLEEIEEITGFTATNVRTLLSRARKTIKEQYLKMKCI